MAAGFSIKEENIDKFREKMINYAEKELSEKDLIPILKIDTKISFNKISKETINLVREFEPFGIGNPEPTFLTEGFEVLESRTVGSGGKHLKLVLRTVDKSIIDAIWFSYQKENPQKGTRLDVVYNLQENSWQGQKQIQLKIKDFKQVAR